MNQALLSVRALWLNDSVDRIHYAGDTVITGTAIAHALLGYAQALAVNGTSATVAIPVYHDDGSRGRAEFLIGPASQVVAESFETTWEEIDDLETVQLLETQAREVGVIRALATDPADDPTATQFPDFGEY